MEMPRLPTGAVQHLCQGTIERRSLLPTTWSGKIVPGTLTFQIKPRYDPKLTGKKGDDQPTISPILCASTSLYRRRRSNPVPQSSCLLHLLAYGPAHSYTSQHVVRRQD